MAKTHIHEYTRRSAASTVETCRCGRFRHTEHAGAAIEAVEVARVIGTGAGEALAQAKPKTRESVNAWAKRTGLFR